MSDHNHDSHDHDHGHDDHDHGHEHHQHELSYEDEVLQLRDAKDDYFRSSHQSPIPHEIRHDFGGLRYFPPNEAFRVEGVTLTPDPDPTDTAEIDTSDGHTRLAWRVGTIEFSVPTGHGRLTGFAFEPGPVTELFIPFQDATSAHETYGAGRYLDLEPEEDGTYALDFNLAYNPWCAYAPQYSCPLPPAENRLAFRIEAGEQTPDLEPES